MEISGLQLQPNVESSSSSVEPCTLSAIRRVAAMLDLNPDDETEGAPLPPGWHFILLGGNTRRSELREDGFPGFGLPMPDLGLPRLLLGGRSVSYDGDIPVGAMVERISRISRLDEKTGPAGRSAIITLQHSLRPVGSSAPAITESQTYILLPASRSASPAQAAGAPVSGQKTVTPDETMLFQYSALGFNSHKIHLDRTHAREVEGLPDLVVNGGLVTLLATEHLRRDLGISPRTLKTRHTAPLYCNRPITFEVTHAGSAFTLAAFDDQGVVAMSLEGEVR